MKHVYRIFPVLLVLSTITSIVSVGYLLGYIAYQKLFAITNISMPIMCIIILCISLLTAYGNATLCIFAINAPDRYPPLKEDERS